MICCKPGWHFGESRPLSHLLLLGSPLMNPPSALIVRALKIQLSNPKSRSVPGRESTATIQKKTPTTADVFSRLLPFVFSTHQVHLSTILKLGIEQLGLQDNIRDEVYVEDVWRCQCSDKK